MSSVENAHASSSIPSGEAERGKQDAQELAYYQRLRVDGELILGGSGFNFRLEPSLPAMMAFDHETRAVLINTDAIAERKLNDQQRRYIVGHEVAHFVQMARDPDAYMRTFELAREHAQKSPEGQQANARKAWDRFYNVFLDINDNAIVDRRSAWTQHLPQADHPRQSLYAKVTDEDLRGASKSEQFLIGVLRKAMLGTEAALKLDDDVQGILEQPYTYLGRKFPSFFAFVRHKFFDADLMPSVLLSALECTARPLFEQFLQKDIASGAIEKQQKPTDLGGSDPDEKQAGAIVKGLKEVKKSGKERANDEAGKRFRGQMADKGFSEGQITRMLQIKERADDVYQKIVDLWGLFLQAQKTFETVEEQGFRSGYKVEVGDFVRQLHRLDTNPDQLRVFVRRLLQPEREVFRPKSIKLYLVLDLSGSMDYDKRQAVQEAAYALSMSLIQFRRNQRSLAREGDLIMDIGLNLIGFGSTFQELLSRSANETTRGTIEDEVASDLEARLWSAILAIGTTELGGTRDAPVLQAIQAELSQHEQEEARKRGDSVAVLIEITDGETETADASAAAVSAFNGKNSVFANGIRIPGLLHADTTPVHRKDEESIRDLNIDSSGAFETVWGKYGHRLDSLEQLRPILLRLFTEALKRRSSDGGN